MVFINIPEGKEKTMGGVSVNWLNNLKNFIMFKKNINVGKFKLQVIKKISEGAYGFVYLVEDKI